ncbi:MAG: hypothetical protein L6R41_007512, partial [Letrouitia leprolyta]
ANGVKDEFRTRPIRAPPLLAQDTYLHHVPTCRQASGPLHEAVPIGSLLAVALVKTHLIEHGPMAPDIVRFEAEFKFHADFAA